MPVTVKKTRKGYVVKEPHKKGRAPKGRTHKSKAKAIRQAQAINLSIARRAGKKVPRRKR